MALKKTLDRLYRLYTGQYLESDPVSLVHRYRAKKDREMVALIAALFAFGRADLIIRAVDRILKIMGKSPSRYLEDSPHHKIIADFKGFQYRFVRGLDLAALLLSLKTCLKSGDSLENFLMSAEGNVEIPSSRSHPLREERVWRLCVILRQALYKAGMEAARENRLKLTRGFSTLLADPLKTSACKRWFLFFRWMVRQDEVDLGIWRFLRPEELIMPVDTHIARIGSLIGLTNKKTAGAGMVKEITENLRTCNPKDPLKYDFALTRLGILKECPRKRAPDLCRRCAISKICVVA